MHLLFVEDSLADADLAIATLRRAGLQFEGHVVDRRKALVEALDLRRWSAVICDYSLPDIDCNDALRIVREHDSDVPFILLSGTIGEERAVEAIRAGANDFVTKDNLMRLAAVVERGVREAGIRDEGKRLEHDLRRAEERYRRTFEKAPIGIVNTDRSGIIISANEKYCAIVGRDRSELIGLHFTTVVHPEDVAISVVAFEDQVRRRTAAVTYERRFLRGDGATAWANITVGTVQNESGEVDYVIALVDEITDKKEAEQTLRAQKELLAEAQTIANVGSWEEDLSSGRWTWSDQLCRIYGFEPGESPPIEALFGRMHPDDRDRMLEMWAKQAEGETSAEFRVVLPDGTHTLHTRTRHVRDSGGRLAKIIGTVQDVTDRVRGEEELRRTAIQQAAIANIGRIVISGMSLEFLLRQAAALIATVLGLEFCEILRKKNGHFILETGEGWENAAIGKEKVSGARGSQASFTVESGQPVVLTDIATEDRFDPSELIIRHGITSGITVAIQSDEEHAWGVLGVYSRQKRTFGATDVDFMRSAAIILSQAIERSRADEELRARALQQSAIAELGRATMNGLDEETFNKACALVTRGLSVDHASFSEVSGDAMGLTVISGRPVIVDDDRKSSSTATPAGEVAEHSIVSGVTVPVASATRIYGTLAALARKPREFGPADLDFMQSLANILAEAMERDRSHQELEESENRYRSVVEGASEIIFTVGMNAEIVTLNHAFETMTGWTREEWIGREFSGLVDPVDRERLLHLYRQVFTTLSPIETEATIIGNGRKVLLEVLACPEVRDGAMTGLYGFARDITESRQFENQRAELTRSLQLVLESTVEGIYTIGGDGRCTMINSAASRMLGDSAEKFIGRNMHAIVHARRADGSAYPEADCPLQPARVSNSVQKGTNEVFWRLDGTRLPVDYSAAPIVDNDVVIGAVIAFTDATERRLLEMKLEQANRLSSLGRMAATIAHEFNNVLMGISPFVDLIRRSPERTDSALDHIARSVVRGKGITHDILRYTQPAVPNREVFDVEPWLKNVGLDVRSMLQATHSVNVSVSDPWLLLDADPNQLHQIITNLVLNARDAMPEGGNIAIDVRREPSGARFPFGVVDHPERFAHFTVRDIGSGMSQDTLRHIFEPLFTTKSSGTGLGLAVTHQVVLNHGGEIFVESEVGAGTTFHIFIPLAEKARASSAAEAAGEIPQAESWEQKPKTPRIHVLLVEDDEAVASGIGALLDLEGFDVGTVGTGAEAISYVERSRPDVVVLDVGLPDMQGTKVYLRLAEIHPGLPVIFSTGHADRSSLDQLSSSGAVRYLLKPFDVDDLIDTIRSAMEP